MQVIIRRGTSADFSQVYELMREFSHFQGTPERVTITPAEMESNQFLFQCYVAEGDNRIIGFASFFPAYYSWTGKALYLDDLFVKEKFRKIGLGKQLLEAVIRHAKEEKYKKIRWQVSKWNTHAIAFYKRMGATVDEVEINCDLLL